MFVFGISLLGILRSFTSVLRLSSKRVIVLACIQNTDMSGHWFAIRYQHSIASWVLLHDVSVDVCNNFQSNHLPNSAEAKQRNSCSTLSELLLKHEQFGPINKVRIALEGQE